MYTLFAHHRVDCLRAFFKRDDLDRSETERFALQLQSELEKFVHYLCHHYDFSWSGNVFVVFYIGAVSEYQPTRLTAPSLCSFPPADGYQCNTVP